MSMKKAGIILSIIFVIIAIGLCIVGSKIINKEKEPEVKTEVQTEVVDNKNQDESTQSQTQDPIQPQPQPQPVQPQPVQPQPVQPQPVQPQPVQPQPVPVQPETTVVEKVITKEISRVKTINENDLGEPLYQKEIIAPITNKRIIVVDENPEMNTSKIINCCFDVLTPDNEKMTLFMTKEVYANFKVGDKLKINYEMYQNNVGVTFPLVLNVTVVE